MPAVQITFAPGQLNDMHRLTLNTRRIPIAAHTQLHKLLSNNAQNLPFLGIEECPCFFFTHKTLLPLQKRRTATLPSKGGAGRLGLALQNRNTQQSGYGAAAQH